MYICCRAEKSCRYDKWSVKWQFSFLFFIISDRSNRCRSDFSGLGRHFLDKELNYFWLIVNKWLTFSELTWQHLLYILSFLFIIHWDDNDSSCSCAFVISTAYGGKSMNDDKSDDDNIWISDFPSSCRQLFCVLTLFGFSLLSIWYKYAQ